MNVRGFASSLLAGGVLSILLSLLAPYFVSGKSAWTEHEALQLQQASQQYHAALHARAHEQHGEEQLDEQEMQSVRQDYEQRSAQLKAAQSRGRNVSAGLRWLGIVGCATGILLGVVRHFQPQMKR